MRWRWPPRTPPLNGLAGRVELLEGDLLAPVAGRRFDLVASNPPYVAVGENVDPEVSGYEPALAVYADDAGGRSTSAWRQARRPPCVRAATSSSKWPRARPRGLRSTLPASATRRSR